MPEAGQFHIERREVYYSGRVQGVGFRYNALRLAASSRVAGFVRNLPDGRVQIVVEGPTSEVDDFLANIANSMADCIRRTESEVRPNVGEFSAFEIRH